jgi:hypothetical protein
LLLRLSAGLQRMPRVAISYRRSDAASAAGRIAEKLVARFGKDDVFLDIDRIPPGTPFREHIKTIITGSDLLLAVIGRHWLDRTNKKRLNDPEDLVRIEIQTALELGIPVIPVLVDDAPMPLAKNLPGPLKKLINLNVAVVDPGRDFHGHADRLGRWIETLVQERAARDRDKAMVGAQALDQVPVTEAEVTEPAPDPGDAGMEAVRAALETLDGIGSATLVRPIEESGLIALKQNPDDAVDAPSAPAEITGGDHGNPDAPEEGPAGSVTSAQARSQLAKQLEALKSAAAQLPSGEVASRPPREEDADPPYQGDVDATGQPGEAAGSDHGVTDASTLPSGIDHPAHDRLVEHLMALTSVAMQPPADQRHDRAGEAEELQPAADQGNPQAEEAGIDAVRAALAEGLGRAAPLVPPASAGALPGWLGKPGHQPAADDPYADIQAGQSYSEAQDKESHTPHGLRRIHLLIAMLVVVGAMVAAVFGIRWLTKDGTVFALLFELTKQDASSSARTDGKPMQDRVAPTAPEQAEKPFQERITPADGTTGRAASREEQPMAIPTPPARSAAPPAQVIAPQQAAPAPATSGPAADQPKRVKTIRIGPDAPVAQSDGTARVTSGEGQPIQPQPSPRPVKTLTVRPPEEGTGRETSGPIQIAPPQPNAKSAAREPARGSFAVQVTAQRSEGDAEAAYRAMQQKYPSVLMGREPIIRRAELSGGTWYRAQIGPFASAAEAEALCGRLKDAGGQCVVQRN